MRPLLLSQSSSLQTYYNANQKFNHYVNKHQDIKDRKKVAYVSTPDEIITLSQLLLDDIQVESLPNTEIINLGKKLTNFMYQLYLQSEGDKLLELFHHMKDQKVQLDASYTIIMRYYSDLHDYHNVYKYYKLLKSDADVEISSRCYIPLITVCLKTSRFDLAEVYLNELNEIMKMRFQDHLYMNIIETCTEVLRKENEVHIRGVVEGILFMLQYYGPTVLKESTTHALKSWFESDTLINWNITTTSMGKKNGMCQFCKHRLSSSIIPPDRLIKLKRNLMTLVKAAIARKKSSKISDIKIERVDTNIKEKVTSNSQYFDLYDAFTMNTVGKVDHLDKGVNSKASDFTTNRLFNTLTGLKDLLDENEPYDVVIDALNIGYFSQGFNPQMVHDVVNMFVLQNKRILILCAGLMKEDLLSDNVVVPEARKRMQWLMQYLNKNCKLFFVESSVVDDYYILYTLLHHDFAINLVSRDQFRDHLYHLNAQNASDFKRWQQANQYIFKAFQKDGMPVFKSRTMYHSSVEKHGQGWHIPVGKTSWICVLKQPCN